MAIDPSIVLGLKPPPVVDPLERQAKVQNVRNLIANNQLHQQQAQINNEKIQQDQISTAKMQRDQQDAERVRQAFIASNGDPQGTIKAAISNGAGPDAITGLQKHFSALDEQTAKINHERLPVEISKNSDLLQLHDQAMEMATQSPAQFSQAWPQMYQQAVKIDPETAKHFSPDQPPTPQQIATSKALHMTQDYFLKSEAEKRAVATNSADLAEKAATTAKLKAETPGAQAASDIKVVQADAMKNYQAGTGPHPIDAALPPTLDKTANAAFKSSFDFAMKSGGPEAAQKVLEAAAGHAASMSPEKQKNDISKAVNQEIAMTPAKVNQAVQTEVQKARLAGGIGQIVDPQQRNEASRTLDAADKEAVDKIGDAQRLKQTIDMSRAGNKVTPNLESIETLRSIVNRVNARELQAVGTPGDAVDRVNSFLGKWTKGQPIPDNIQKDFLAVAEGQQKLAEQKHKVTYGVVSQRFGVKDLQPPDIAGIYSKASGGSTGGVSKYKAGDTRTIDGVNYTRNDKGEWHPE